MNRLLVIVASKVLFELRGSIEEDKTLWLAFILEEEEIKDLNDRSVSTK